MGKSRTIFTLLILMITWIVWTGFADKKPITQDNWLNHPEVVEVRKLYNDIEQAIKEKRLILQTKDIAYTGPHQPTLKKVFIDENHAVRKYVEERGSEDSSLTCNFYYDTNKMLRFVFVEGAAVCGSVLEHRIYFDFCGKRMWENSKYTKGPEGYWPAEWPEKALIREPWSRFNQD